jgi:hypothetical protein
LIRSEFLSDLRARSRAIRNDIQQHFYFLESEDLRRKPARGSWSIIEVFAHINLVQGFYIKNIREALERASEVNHDEVNFSWIGKQAIKYMSPVDGQVKYKVKTFKKVDPVARQKRGIAIDEKVIFQDLIADIEELEELMIKAYDYDLESEKVPTVISWIKLNIADALEFNLAHTERHLLQARRIVEPEEA